MAMSRTRKTILIISSILVALVLVAILGFAVLLAAFGQRTPNIRDNSVLVLRVAGPLPDYVPDDPLRKFFGGPEESLSNLVLQFRKAKVDKRLKAIVLDINMSGAGWAKAEEIRDAITDFRSSGKQVYAYMELGMNKEYYIATACDRIYLAPPGELFINGLAAEVMFFRGSLDKVGIYPDIYQIGKYKSVGDMFTRKEMSEAHREYINSLLDDLFNRYVEGIATARGKTPDEVRAIIDNSPYGSLKAKEAGLIDSAAYRDELNKEIKSKLGYKESDELRLVRGGEYREVPPESLGLDNLTVRNSRVIPRCNYVGSEEKVCRDCPKALIAIGRFCDGAAPWLLRGLMRLTKSEIGNRQSEIGNPAFTIHPPPTTSSSR